MAGAIYALVGAATSAVVPTALSVLLALTGTIDVLAGTMVLLLLVVFIAVNAAVLALRRDHVEHRHFRVPVVLPIGGLVSCLLLMTQVEGEVWRRGLPFLAVAAVLAGIAVWRRKTTRQKVVDDTGAAPSA